MDEIENGGERHGKDKEVSFLVVLGVDYPCFAASGSNKVMREKDRSDGSKKWK